MLKAIAFYYFSPTGDTKKAGDALAFAMQRRSTPLIFQGSECAIRELPYQGTYPAVTAARSTDTKTQRL